MFVSADGEVRRQRVSLGRSNEQYVQVLEGLKPGEEVLLTNPELVTEDDGGEEAAPGKKGGGRPPNGRPSGASSKKGGKGSKWMNKTFKGRQVGPGGGRKTGRRRGRMGRRRGARKRGARRGMGARLRRGAGMGARLRRGAGMRGARGRPRTGHEGHRHAQPMRGTR